MESFILKQLGGSHFHFLKFLTKCANFFSIGLVKNLVFELSLDKQVLYESQSGQIFPFSAEIRKKVLGEIHETL